MRRRPTAAREVRDVIEEARRCARLAGGDTIEAEHLLLALANNPATVANVVLANAGLTPERISDALAVEQAQSLATVGVTEIPTPMPALVPDVRHLGASARLAITRGATAAKTRRERRMRSGHVLIGVLSADLGRVPRALAAAGIDRQALLLETQGALDSYFKRAS